MSCDCVLISPYSFCQLLCKGELVVNVAVPLFIVETLCIRTHGNISIITIYTDTQHTHVPARAHTQDTKQTE